MAAPIDTVECHPGTEAMLFTALPGENVTL